MDRTGEVAAGLTDAELDDVLDDLAALEPVVPMGKRGHS